MVTWRSTAGLGCVAVTAALGCASAQAPVVAAPVTTRGTEAPRASACDAVECGPELRCEETHGRTSCVPIMRPRRAFCGGIGNIQCPDGARCVDDPDDDCDPARGGRDCGGVCEGAR